MPDVTSRVQQLDHVELFVPDRTEAAAWYEHVLGLTWVAGLEHWAQDPHGPLMISPDGGNTKLALFEDASRAGERGAFDQVAFRIGGPGFLAFLERLPMLSLRNSDDETLSAESVRDHDGCFSLHFVDPWGHRIEVTTYECEYVSGRLA